MNNAAKVAKLLLASAQAAVARGGAGLGALESTPVAVYATDAEGVITWYNRACVTLAGRTPAVGEDRWCVSWRLWSDDGARLAHDNCPMALAIKERRAIRDVSAIVERPDGTCANVLPFPTPVMAADGEFLGAVNVLVDITEHRRMEQLRTQIERCRRLSASFTDAALNATFADLAYEYEQAAADLKRRPTR